MIRIIKKYVPFFLIALTSLAWSAEAHEPIRLLNVFPPQYLYEKTAGKNLKSFESQNLRMTLVSEETIPDLTRILGDDGNTKLFWLGMQEAPESEDLAVAIQNFVKWNKYYLIDYAREVNSFPLMLTWLAYQKGTDQLVGYVGMGIIEPEDLEQLSESLLQTNELEASAHLNFSTIVIPSMQRKGYATEMGLTVVKNIFTYTTANIIVNCSKLENTAPLELIRKYLSGKSQENSDIGQIKIEKRTSPTEIMYLYSKVE